jgi:multiple sugar transport system permease protein
MTRKETRQLLTGLGFIAPNIIGFLAFTLLPLILSMAMAFTDWDIRLHNMFTDNPIRFVGIDNFRRLWGDPYFGQSLRNTLFLMMGIPLGVGGSLCAALLLSNDLKAGRNGRVLVLVTTGLILGGLLMILAGGTLTTMTMLFMGLAGFVLVSGVVIGRTTYRTLFYFPHFTAGVATFLLWKKLYNPYTGPVNGMLRGPLLWLEGVVNGLPPEVVRHGAGVSVAVAVLLIGWAAYRMVRDRLENEVGALPLCLGAAFLYLPCGLAIHWQVASSLLWPLQMAGGVAVVLVVAALFRRSDRRCLWDTGLSRTLIEAGLTMVGVFICVGMTFVFRGLPEMAQAGLEPPQWLTQYHWAKPALMIMGFWAAFGSNNMLLYLAGISNIPPDLYEAADIDGASGMQRFWNITWPQLAPVTFFIFVMSIIGGLQGGFEQARTMTAGGPARSTTTLSYYVYQEGFDAGHLGFASAIAWTLFLLVFVITIFNWKFGNRRVND